MVFLYKLSEGICEHSFGIDVAKTVGLPDKIIQQAKEIAGEFEFPSNKKVLNINARFN